MSTPTPAVPLITIPGAPPQPLQSSVSLVIKGSGAPAEHR